MPEKRSDRGYVLCELLALTKGRLNDLEAANVGEEVTHGLVRRRLVVRCWLNSSLNGGVGFAIAVGGAVGRCLFD